VRIKSEVQEAGKRKFRIGHPSKKKRAKVSRDGKHSFALEMVLPILGETGIRGGFAPNMEEHRSHRT
jgi:hypothetical protein